ncbi:hypothetical protein [Acetobacter sp. LMG 32666]|uniref:hypothetical protein n=1 Tax=Acetobacter sp. LMG 32666 TaxID=2959295 RepID=UPI0030C89888
MFHTCQTSTPGLVLSTGPGGLAYLSTTTAQPGYSGPRHSGGPCGPVLRTPHPP